MQLKQERGPAAVASNSWCPQVDNFLWKLCSTITTYHWMSPLFAWLYVKQIIHSAGLRVRCSRCGCEWLLSYKLWYVHECLLRNMKGAVMLALMGVTNGQLSCWGLSRHRQATCFASARKHAPTAVTVCIEYCLEAASNSNGHKAVFRTHDLASSAAYFRTCLQACAVTPHPKVCQFSDFRQPCFHW